jgi:hypothetical protein
MTRALIQLLSLNSRKETVTIAEGAQPLKVLAMDAKYFKKFKRLAYFRTII